MCYLGHAEHQGKNRTIKPRSKNTFFDIPLIQGFIDWEFVCTIVNQSNSFSDNLHFHLSQPGSYDTGSPGIPDSKDHICSLPLAPNSADCHFLPPNGGLEKDLSGKKKNDCIY